MKKLTFLVGASLVFFTAMQLFAKKTKSSSSRNNNGIFMDQQSNKKKNIDHSKVIKKTLSNGMTVLVRPVHNVPKVSLQIWYNVGSKDEKDGERGIAHLIEHMLFKGTKEMLSESDINMLVHKLSGYTNAFTSYDYTGYLFDFPTHHWQEALPVMADTMKNAAFKDPHLNSEMKAVIQELKMYKDRYQSSLVENLLTTIFAEHPYHYPIIGYKQDLWSVTGDDLRKFYDKHYVPNNTTLVVVGDVQPEEVFELAEKHFGSIPADPDYKKDEFYLNKDIASKSVTLYRDVKQPVVYYTFMVPGSQEKQDYVLNLISIILGSGKGSRLYRKLVDELHLTTSFETFVYDLFEHGLFFFAYEPKDIADIPEIERIIHEEIQDIIDNGLQEDELVRAVKKTQMKIYSVLENTQDQAYQIGQYYLATGDENYIFKYLNWPLDTLEKEMKTLLSEYVRPTVGHKGTVLSLPESEKEHWQKLQELSDQEDQRILSARERNTPIEPPVYANKVEVKKPGEFAFAKAQTIELDNGLKVLHHDNKNTPKINIVVSFKAKHFYDPQDKQGLCNFVSAMLKEGTKNYTAAELADAIETRGMSLSAYAGGIAMSVLHDDLEKGLELLEEIVSRSVFDKKEMAKVKDQLLTDIKNFWDEPSAFAGQLLKEDIYQGHPYSKNQLGTKESIEKIKQKDLIKFYDDYITPQKTVMAIVGDLSGYNIKEVLQNTIAKWQGPDVQELDYPAVEVQEKRVHVHPINRDQVVLAYARPSVERLHKDFDKLYIFDQIFGGGALGSMSSKLFQLREESGLFYTINGSTTVMANEQPGMFLVKTIVSLDRLAEAEKVIKHTIDTVVDTITPHEFEEAKNAIANGLVNNFEANNSMAASFIFLDKYKLPADFFDKRAQQLAKITLDEMKQAVKTIVSTSNLLTLKVGRVDQKEKSQ